LAAIRTGGATCRGLLLECAAARLCTSRNCRYPRSRGACAPPCLVSPTSLASTPWIRTS
jgi:hypothetical protein